MAAPTAVIVKGNPKYLAGNPHAEAFYGDLEAHLKGLGYGVSFDPGEPHTTPKPADLWVGHSRGASRLRFAPEGTRTVALGTADGLYHPEDNSLHDFDVTPNEYHYMLTQEMKDALAGAPMTSVQKLAARLKNPEGGLTAAGRRHYAKTEGANLKPGVKNVDKAGDSEKKRWARWAVRFYSNPRGPMTNAKGEPTRLALMANAWGTKVPKTREEAQSIAARGREILEKAKGSEKKSSYMGAQMALAELGL